MKYKWTTNTVQKKTMQKCSTTNNVLQYQAKGTERKTNT